MVEAKWPSVRTPSKSWRELAKAEGPVWCPERRIWLVHRAEDINAVCSNPEVFSNQVAGERNLNYDFLLTVDPPRHTLDRTNFLRCFGPTLRRAYAQVPQLVADGGNALASGNEIDLVADFCHPLGQAVAESVLGCPIPDPESGDLSDRAEQLLANCDSAPGIDVGTPLRQLRDKILGYSSSDEAMGRTRGLAAAMLVACETTLPAAVALAIWNDAQPGGWGPCVPPRSPLIADTPLLGLFRSVTRRAEVGGTTFRAEDDLFLCFGAANLASRTSGSCRDYSFGVGIHSCPARRLVERTVAASVEYAHRSFAVRSELGQLDVREHGHLREPTSLPALTRRP